MMALTQESAARKDRTSMEGKSAKLEHRHFAFIAAVLAECAPAGKHSFGGMKLAQWRAVVEHFSDACASSNPRFDRARFLKACGVQS